MMERYRSQIGTRIEGLAAMGMGSEQEKFEGQFLDGVNGPTPVPVRTCALCGREYTITDVDTSESGDAWGRPDLCHACAWQRAIEAGCTHTETCRCAQ